MSLSLELTGVVIALRQKAATDLQTKLRTQSSLCDPVTHLDLLAIRLDSEPSHGLLGQQPTSEPQPRLAMADPGAGTGAFQSSAEPRDEMGIIGEDNRLMLLRHDDLLR